MQGVYDFKAMFHFQEAPLELSTVSSNPTRVCVCINEYPDCNITLYNVTAYPGEAFQIPAVAVGQRFGTIVPHLIVKSCVHTTHSHKNFSRLTLT